MKQLSEFRSNLREAFNDAEAGKPVYIERFGKVFELVHRPNYKQTDDGAMAIVIKPTAPLPHKREVLTAEDGSTATTKKIRLATPINLPQSKMRPEPKYCKAGHLLSPTGRCLQKGCKWN